MNKRCIIIGSGNSIQEGLDKGIQDLLKTEITFTLNEEFRFFNSTVTVFGDWTFYKYRYKLLEKHPLIIGIWNRHIGRIDEETNELYCPLLSQLILLPGCSKYLGKDSWKKGFYTPKLTGLFTLTFAIACEFEEIYLIGYDGCAINGKTHHYEGIEGFGHFFNGEEKPRTGMGFKKNGEYKSGIFNKSKKDYNLELWNNYKSELDRIKIYNVSLESRIDTFPKISYDEFISIIKNNPSNINQDLIRKEIKQYVTDNAKFDKNHFNFIC